MVELLHMIFWIALLLSGVSLTVSCPIADDGAQTCDIIITETIPNNLTYDSQAPIIIPIWKVWENLINNANKRIRINSFYWTMLGPDVLNNTDLPTSANGKYIFNLLLEKSKKIPLEIVQNGNEETNDLILLKKNALVKVYYIDFSRLVNGGVQHSKVLIGDDKSAYVGSANMDWRSLSEIKELGVYIPDCQEIVEDINKFWLVLKNLSGPSSKVPVNWPPYLYPKYNHTHPLSASVNGIPSNLYIATSPPQFNTPHRTDDLTAVLRTIDRATEFVYISVMDFIPLELFYGKEVDRFWPIIENKLKTVAIEKEITVKLLISKWPHTRFDMITYLQSLKYLSRNYKIKIEVKLFIIPAFREYQRNIPFSRVSHSKYMVTDNTAYVGTSNWSGDYFKYSGGVSVITEEIKPDRNNSKSLRTNLENIFNTDWFSIYAHDLY